MSAVYWRGSLDYNFRVGTRNTVSWDVGLNEVKLSIGNLIAASATVVYTVVKSPRRRNAYNPYERIVIWGD